MGFQQSTNASVALWTGNPDCDAAQTFLRDWLRANAPSYPSAWIRRDTRTQGNLGEVIAFCVGAYHAHPNLQCFPANVFNPFSGISRNEIDLLWIGFGSSPDRDFLILQEVKTTFSDDLQYANSLLADYDKIFGNDPKLWLNTRLQGIKATLRYQHHRADLAARVNAFQAVNPATASRVTIIPTLIHDLASEDPAAKMAGISDALTADGWTNISCWAVGLSQLEDRMQRITQDQP